ncbi:MAG TPA: thioredoxin domain-containing protein [Chryseosolibacter sp.]|nr:thioredoxin domain-containing protein [Chryseosolibacter sp.]
MMKKLFLYLLVCLPALATAQSAPIIDSKTLIERLNAKSDQIEVVNFWATWCGPCVAELPLFEKLNNEGRSGIKVTLVSMDLDLVDDPQKVYKFVALKKIKSEVLIVDEPDANSWIDDIHSEWSGSLPATLVINHKTGKRKFVANPVREGDLERLIDAVK